MRGYLMQFAGAIHEDLYVFNQCPEKLIGEGFLFSAKNHQQFHQLTSVFST